MALASNNDVVDDLNVDDIEDDVINSIDQVNSVRYRAGTVDYVRG